MVYSVFLFLFFLNFAGFHPLRFFSICISTRKIHSNTGVNQTVQAGILSVVNSREGEGFNPIITRQQNLEIQNSLG